MGIGHGIFDEHLSLDCILTLMYGGGCLFNIDKVLIQFHLLYLGNCPAFIRFTTTHLQHSH